MCNRQLPPRKRRLLTLLQPAAKLCNTQLTGLQLLLHGVQHKMQSGSQHCSRWGWIVVKQLCSGELLLLTDSAMQMRLRKMGIL